MRLLLILTIFFSLTQLASAERWRGLIASVAAFESAKEQKSVKLAPVPKLVENGDSKVNKVEYQKECTDNNCIFIPKAISIEKATKTIKDRKKSVSPPATKTKKTFTKQRFRLFRKNCSSRR